MVEPKVLLGNKEYSIKSIRGFSITFYILGAILMIASFFIMPIGILFLIFGLIIFFMGNSYRKMVKKALSPTSPLVTDKEQSLQPAYDETVSELKPIQPIQVKAAKEDTELQFCSNCGAEFGSGKFCSECGTPVAQKHVVPAQPTTIVSGHDIKMCLNCGDRLLTQAKVCPSCGARAKNYPVINSNDIERINQIKANAKHIDYKTSFMNSVSPQSNMNVSSPNTILSKKEHIKQNKANGVACCPKCGSTSLSANKKGFGVGKAVVGAWALGPVGLVAGNAGAKKVIVTCLSCGHQWKV